MKDWKGIWLMFYREQYDNLKVFSNARILATAVIIAKLALAKLLKQDNPAIDSKHSIQKLSWCLIRFGVILVYCYICYRTFLFEKREKFVASKLRL